MIAAHGETTWPRDPDGALLYPGRREAMTDAQRKARMGGGEPYALRLDMAQAIARAGSLALAGRRGRARPARAGRSRRARKPGAM